MKALGLSSTVVLPVTTESWNWGWDEKKCGYCLVFAL